MLCDCSKNINCRNFVDITAHSLLVSSNLWTLQNHSITCKVQSLELGTQVTKKKKVSQFIPVLGPVGCRLDTPVRKVIAAPKTNSVCFNDTANKFCVISEILFEDTVIIIFRANSFKGNNIYCRQILNLGGFGQ